MFWIAYIYGMDDFCVIESPTEEKPNEEMRVRAIGEGYQTLEEANKAFDDFCKKRDRMG